MEWLYIVFYVGMAITLLVHSAPVVRVAQFVTGMTAAIIAVVLLVPHL